MHSISWIALAVDLSKWSCHVGLGCANNSGTSSHNDTEVATSGAAYYAATLLLEVGWLQIAYHFITVWLKKRLAGLRRRHHSQGGYEQTSSDSAAEGAEDEDVQDERLALQSGKAPLVLLCVLV